MNQKWLRRHIESLEDLQALRVEVIADLREKQDALLEEKQREIDNLKSQLTIGVVQC